MARAPRSQEQGEQQAGGKEVVTPLANGPVPERDVGQNPLVKGNDIIADVSGKKPPSADPPPKIRHFRVTRGGNVTTARTGGYRTTIKPGKIITDQNYDIRLLLEQGISLKEVKPGDSDYGAGMGTLEELPEE